MDPFAAIYPDILEKSVQEAGDLIGEEPELKGMGSVTGKPAEVFSPPKKRFGLASFRIKGQAEAPGVYLLFGLDLAIELAGRLIMLPADEIAASKKQGSLEGELLDAFSEIANIISGSLNGVCHEGFPDKKLHFVRGEMEVYPAKAKEVPLPEESLSAYFAEIALGGKSLGEVRFFLPQSLVAENAREVESGEELEAAAEDILEVTEEADGEEVVVLEAAPDEETSLVDQETIDAVLIDGLTAVQEELEAFLGDTVEFVEPQTGYKKKQDLLAKTRGKLVLARIAASGERSGEGFMLLPLKDAVYFGGVLLMMPPDGIAQTVKQGKFEGEVADAFGEIANILVGTYSQRFKAAEPIGLTLKKGAVEALVASQVDMESGAPFAGGDYYLLSARIRMGEKTYGPLELFFPPHLLGLTKDASHAGVEKTSAAQKPGIGQKTDIAGKGKGRVITIIGDDPSQFAMVEQSITEADVVASRLSLDEDYKQGLSRDDLSCVFLMISKVNDRGLAKAIKVRSAMKRDCPLIVAGPEWTRSMVVKARRYGATDILMTPAAQEVVRRKYRKYI
jgi:chemotaxis protein CheY-P-specific phosphatase CheC